jgi:class 3 adenylate cyclase
MAELPSGTVTFLFSDIEGSTRLLRQLGDRWEDALARHNQILRDAFAESGGREVDCQGDAFFAVFPRARNAIAAATASQRALEAEEWPGGSLLRVRMGIHTGEPSVGGEGYLGLDVVRAARICATAHGGQVLVSETTRALVRGDELGGVELRDLGEHHLKDLEHPERLYQLAVPGLRGDFPEPRGLDRPEASPPVPMAGREDALAALASSTVAGLDQLGPTIDRQIRDALARKGISAVERPAPERSAEKPKVKSEPVSALIAVIVVATLAALVAIVYLIVQAF